MYNENRKDREALAISLKNLNFPDFLIILSVTIIYPFDDNSLIPKKLYKKVNLLSNESSLLFSEVLEQKISLEDWEAYSLSILELYTDLAMQYSSSRHYLAWNRVLLAYKNDF